MKVEIVIDSNVVEAYAVIYTNEVTDEVNSIMKKIKNIDQKVALNEDGKTYIVKPKDIYLIQVDDGKLKVYDKDRMYYINNCVQDKY
ncbi:MAG: hypothetical protein RBQ97_06425 [Acholeplasma sp.]|nr:hypothetical protein [Acholeplasma sp.]